MKKILIILFFSLCLNAFTLNVATAPNYPPYEYLENEELKGFDVEVMQEIAKRINAQINFKFMDFDALITALKSGKVDVIGAIMKRTPLRERAVDFSIDFKKSSNYFLTLDKVNDDIKNCKEFDFSDKIIGAELGSIQFDIAQKISNKVKSYTDSSISILALKNKKIDVLILDKAAAIKFKQKNKDLNILCEYPDEVGQGFAVNKGNLELLEKINQALNSMLKDKTIEKIAKKYGI